jgi:hypothetical protein
VTVDSLVNKWGATDQATQESAQAQLIYRTFKRMQTDGAGSDGQGIGLYTHYTMYGDTRPQYDTGLITPTHARSVYNVWKCLPGC